MIDRAGALAALDVSRETTARLDHFVALLEKWNRAINLVSPRSLSEVWSRHILDSAQILALARRPVARWADLGSGGGFPGLVIALLAAEKMPHLSVTLVESDSRKAAFLSTAAHELGLRVSIHSERIEDTAPLTADVVSARALAPLPVLIPLARRHLAPGGALLLHKGAGAEAELAESLERWRFSVQKHRSRTDPEAVILEIGEIERA